MGLDHCSLDAKINAVRNFSAWTSDALSASQTKQIKPAGHWSLAGFRDPVFRQSPELSPRDAFKLDALCKFCA